MKTLVALLATLLLVGVASAQDVKIGFVDLQRALNESDAGARAKAEFKVQMDKLKSDLKKQQDDIEALKDRLEKKAMVLKEEERRRLETDLQKKMRDFDRAYKDSQAELQSKDNELTANILRDLQELIQEIGEREGFLTILEASSNPVLYSAKSADLTDRIIQLYNQKNKH